MKQKCLRIDQLKLNFWGLSSINFTLFTFEYFVPYITVNEALLVNIKVLDKTCVQKP